MTIFDSLLDMLTDFIPWPPVAWDVPLTRSKQTIYRISMWSEQAKRWVLL